MKTIALFSSLFAVSLAHAWSPGIAPTMPVTNFDVDTSSRNDVISFYQNIYIASEDFASKIQWTGNADTCNAGTISRDFIDQVHRRVNYYRALAGVPASIVMNDASTVLTNSVFYQAPNIPSANTTKAQAAQQSALIVTRMNSLTHSPDPNDNRFCFTPQGGNGSEFGNIAVGLFGPDAINGYIREDKDNPAAGHRRWIFLDEATNFATGDIPPNGSRRASNSLYVFQRPTELTTQTPQFVAWPYAGKFPRQHSTEYWSLSYPKADFANATVTVKKNGQPVTVASINRVTGFGHNSIVWHIPSILLEKLSDDDSTYTVTVANIGGGGPTSYTYDITFFNANYLDSPPTLSGSDIVSPGGSRQISIGGIDIAEQYRLRVGKKSPLAPTVVEGAEDATQSMIIPGPVTGPHYQVRSTTYRRAGLKSLNVAFTEGAQKEQWIEFNRIFYPKASAKIHFYRRLSFMNLITTFAAQYCVNDSGRWIDIPGSAVSGTSLMTGNPVETNTAFSALLSYDLPAATIGKATRIRLVLRKEEHIVDPSNEAKIIFITSAPNTASGAFVDDVTFSNMDWVSKETIQVLSKDATSVAFDATAAGEPLVTGASYAMRLQPRVGKLWMTSSETSEITVSSNRAPTLQPIAGPIVVAEDANTQEVPLAGISAGLEEVQTLTITATSSNPSLIPHPTVSYTNPNSTGILRFKPNANLSGTATITVQVSDGQATNSTTTRSFEVQVQPVNDAPTIAAIANRSINEDLSTGAIAFTLLDIDSPVANLRVSASSSNSELVPAAAMTLAGTTASRSITIKPSANRFGTATITLTATDGSASSTTSFLLTVNPVNDLPTLNLIANRIMAEDSPEQSVELTGVSAGPWENDQPLSITAISSNPAIIPNPVVNYSPGNESGTLSFTPRPDAFGTVTLTVTLRDGQATLNNVVRKFTVTVTAVNDSPTVSSLNDLTIPEDTRSAPLPLAIFDRETAGASLRINRISSNPTLLPAATGIILGGTGNNRTLILAPALNQHGTSQVTIEVSDGLITVRTIFTLTVESVNDAPTLAVIANPAAINEDAPMQTRPLAGIGTGAPNEAQTLIVTATSNNPSVVPNPTVNYQSPSATGSLSYAPVANASGTAIISVTVSDQQQTQSSITRSFTVIVRPVNDAPTISPIQPINLTQSTSSGPISFTVNDQESLAETLRVTAASNNTTLLPTTAMVLGGAGANRTITLNPVANRTGTAVVTLTLTDGVATARTTIAVTVSANIPGPSMLLAAAAPMEKMAITQEGADGLPYCIEYQPPIAQVFYLDAPNPLFDEVALTLTIDLPNAEISDQHCYRAEYSDDGETWFADGVTQQRTAEGLTATAPRGDANQRLMRWKVTSAQP